MQENINVYNEEEFKLHFSQTDLYKTINKDYDDVSWVEPRGLRPYSLLWNQRKDALIASAQGLSRPWVNQTPRFVRAQMNWFSVTSFYYLNFLLEKNPTTIYDLGCGDNMFKKYIPNIIGIEPSQTCENVDIIDKVDQTFIDSHQNYFESVFSICALHFHPFTELRKVVDDFISMVKIGGRGFIALNVLRMFELEAKEKNISVADHPFLKDKAVGIIIPNQKVIEEAENLTKKLLSGLNCDILVFDVDYSKGFNSSLGGNIRIVFERNE